MSQPTSPDAVREHASVASESTCEGPSIAASRNASETPVFVLSEGGGNGRARGVGEPRPFRLPSLASARDCEAYVYLCERPDVWRAWCAVAREYPSARPSSLVVLVRLRGIPIASQYACSFARIHRATTRAQKAAA
jgi:hypothetical protein